MLQHTVAHCKTLQHTASHCSKLQHTNTLQHTATHCNTLQHTATHCNILQHTATYCNTCCLLPTGRQSQKSAHCSILQHATIYCNILQHSATRCKTLQHAATRCNTLQHSATHSNTCNTLQHTATHCNTLLIWLCRCSINTVKHLWRSKSPSGKDCNGLHHCRYIFTPSIIKVWIHTLYKRLLRSSACWDHTRTVQTTAACCKTLHFEHTEPHFAKQLCICLLRSLPVEIVQEPFSGYHEVVFLPIESEQCAL